MSATSTAYPQACGEWIVAQGPPRPGPPRSGQRVHILDLASGRARLAVQLADCGAEVRCLDQDLIACTTLNRQLFRGGELDASHQAVRQYRITPVAGRAETIPFCDTSFDLVSVAESLHRIAPGLAFAEIARVLRPGGSLIAVYRTRDDSIPWVKRLADLVRRFDSSLMSGNFDHGAISTLTESVYFDQPQRRDFRHWIPITRPGLLSMVQRNPAAAALPAAQLEQLLAEVGEVYDSSARAPEPLLLPFHASVWRAQVNHSLVKFASPADDGLQIRLPC